MWSSNDSYFGMVRSNKKIESCSLVGRLTKNWDSNNSHHTKINEEWNCEFKSNLVCV